MREDLKENIKQSLQKRLPFLLSLLFVFCVYAPSSVGIANVIRPAMGAVCVFYWVLNRPDLFNMFTVFFLGFASDIMSSAPLGADIITYLTIYVMVSNLTSFFVNKSFLVIWYGFAFVFLSAQLLKWLVVSVYYAHFLPVSNLFFTIFFTIACYPVVSYINDTMRKYLMNDEG